MLWRFADCRRVIVALDAIADHLVMIDTEHRRPGCPIMATLAAVGRSDMHGILTPGNNTIMTGYARPMHDTVVHDRIFDKTEGGMTGIARGIDNNMAGWHSWCGDIVVTRIASNGQFFEKAAVVAVTTTEPLMMPS